MFKKGRIAIILSALAMLSILISACGSDNTTTASAPTPTPTTGPTGKFTCVTGSLKVDGSTALQPLAVALQKQYTGKCAGADISVQGGGSKTGLGDVESGSVDVGNSDLYADPATQTDLTDHHIAVVIFTVVVNPKVTGVTNLTSAQLKDIYTGKDTNWKDVGGNDLQITVVSRPASSGTRATFRQYILGGTPENPSKASNLTQDSTQIVLQTVEQTDGAIGYAALGNAQGEGAKLNILKIDGNAPTAELTKNNTYKFWNVEHMYTKGAPKAGSLAEAFISYALSADGKTAADTLLFVHISDMTKAALAAHPAPSAS